MDGRRAQARVAVVRAVKIVRQKIFVIILLSLSSRDYFSVGFPVTRAGRGTGSAAATPGAVCVTTRGRRQTVTNGNFYEFIFIFFVQTTRRPAERYDNIMSIYVYNIMPARVCWEKETVRTLTLTRIHTRAHFRYSTTWIGVFLVRVR